MTKFKLFLIFILLGITSFTHLFRIDKTFIFQNDEGRDALITYRMISTGKPVLLGPETSVGNMYLGPFYYYLMTPALYLSGLDPVGPAIMVAILGIISTFLLVYLGSKKFDFSTGYFAGLFYALSPVMVHYSRSSWNPNVIPFFILLLLIIRQKQKLWYSLFFGVLTGIIFQLHYVALVVPALLLLKDIIIAVQTKKWTHFLKNLGLIILGFVLSSFPFWLFEIRHGFVNSHAFIDYLLKSGSPNSLGYPPYLVRVWGNFKLVISGIIGSASLIKGPVSFSLQLFAALSLLIYLLREKGTFSYLFIVSIFITSVLKENINVHYFAYLFPLVALMIGRALSYPGFWRIPAILLIISLIMPSYSSFHYDLLELDSSDPRRAQDVANYLVKEAAGRPYNVVNYSSSSSSTILYDLAISANPPRTDDQSLLFVICLKALCSDDILTSNNLFLNGPSHPTLINYLGYTPRLHTSVKRQLIKNEWVTYDVFVATVLVNP